MTPLPTSRREALLRGEKWYLTGLPCVHGHTDKRRAKTGECSACRVVGVQVWRKRNPEAVKAQLRKQYLEAPHKAAANARKWAKKNPAKVLAATRMRQAGKTLRTPKWLTADDFWLMQEVYELAAIRTTVTGVGWHVDHILPLHGKKVSGLHVPSNLNVVPARYNLRKANRFEVLT